MTDTMGTQPRDGQWSASTSDERWHGGFFDTREEAVAHGRTLGAAKFFVGQVYNLTDEEVVGAIVRDEEDADGSLLCHDEHCDWCDADDECQPPPSLGYVERTDGDEMLMLADEAAEPTPWRFLFGLGVGVVAIIWWVCR